MADQPAPTVSAPVAQPPPQQQAPTQTPATTAPAAPAAPVSAPVAENTLSGDQVIEIAGQDGTTNYVRMGDLVNAYRSRADVDPNEVEELRTVRDALKGKPEAVQKLMTSFQGGAVQPTAGAQPTGSQVDSAELQALRQQVASMEEAINEARGVTGQISALQERNQIQATVTQYAQHIPYVAKLGEQGAELIRNEYHRQMAAAREGRHPDFPGVRLNASNTLPQHKERLLGLSMRSIENQVAGLASGLGFTLQNPPPAAAAPAAPADPGGLINDQTGTEPAFRQSQLRYNPQTNRIERVATGAAIEQNRMGHAVDAIIPTDMIPPAAGGTAIPVGTPPSHRGTSFDQAGLVARMQQRLNEAARNSQ